MKEESEKTVQAFLRESIQRIEEARDSQAVSACADEYNRGFYNGLELAAADLPSA